VHSRLRTPFRPNRWVGYHPAAGREEIWNNENRAPCREWRRPKRPRERVARCNRRGTDVRFAGAAEGRAAGRPPGDFFKLSLRGLGKSEPRHRLARRSPLHPFRFSPRDRSGERQRPDGLRQPIGARASALADTWHPRAGIHNASTRWPTHGIHALTLACFRNCYGGGGAAWRFFLSHFARFFFSSWLPRIPTPPLLRQAINALTLVAAKKNLRRAQTPSPPTAREIGKWAGELTYRGRDSTELWLLQPIG
jgi:hypothetical protein